MSNEHPTASRSASGATAGTTRGRGVEKSTVARQARETIDHHISPPNIGTFFHGQEQSDAR